MKKHLLLTAIVLALVLCFSCGIFAAPITSDKDNPNQYSITDNLQNFTSDDLWIGTLADWKAEKKAVGDTGTVFENGEAIDDDDIIITNGKIGIALAVGTRNPWGYPAGSILDAGYCDEDGNAKRDTVWAIEFLAHRWDSWAPDNCGTVTFDVVKYDFAAGKEAATGIDAVKVSRIYNQMENVPFDVVSYYSLGQIGGENVVYYFTQMTNKGTKEVTIKNDIAITNKGDDGGAMEYKTSRHISGNYGNVEGKKFSTFVVAPDVTEEEWAAGTAYDKGSVGYKELVQENTYKPGDSKLLKHYVVIDDEASTEAVHNFLNAYSKANTVEVSGQVVDAEGKPVANPVIVVNDGGKTFGWYFGDEDGKYSIDLPKVSGADYTAFVEVSGKAAGDEIDLPVKKYTDVKANTWYTEALDQLTLIGCISGYPDGTFRPNSSITRAEFAQMLYGVIDKDGKTEGKAIAFPDVKDGKWYKEAVDYLSANKIISGYPDGTFRPDAPITRAEMAVMIYKATALDKENYKKFSDVKPNCWYYEAVMALANNGILYGYPDGTFKPEQTATRAECASALYGIPSTDIELVTGGDKVEVTFNLKDSDGNPVYGRIELFVPGEEKDTWETAYPTVRFCGDSVYLDYVANDDPKGEIKVDVAPGKYKAVVYGEGFWFYSDPIEVIGDTTKTADLNQTVTVEMKYSAPEGWLSGDLHHHANKNDAFADPKDAIPSLVASGLDVAFITDHDFTVNNYAAYTYAREYEMEGFIPSEEISCSWAHFNVIPLNEESYAFFLDEERENHVMDQFGKLPDFVKQTHDKGAAITANHPWYSYGLFSNKSKAPGGYTDDYDNIEINSCSDNTENLQTLNSAVKLWTAYVTGEKDNFFGEVKKPHYLVGGSDTHDVLYYGFADDKYKNTKRSSTDYVSGKVRTFAFVGETANNDITENGLAYAEAVVNGASFTSFGPILDPSKIPGQEYTTTNGTFDLTVDISSLAKIKDVIVLSGTAKDKYDNATFKDLPYEAGYSVKGINKNEYKLELKFQVAPGKSNWVSILVVDENDSYAISNPYWVKGVETESPDNEKPEL